jgi:FMN phosphatase YigB (HAD superfamily)
VDGVIIFHEVGCEKPDPHHTFSFSARMRVTDIPDKNDWMIGDHLPHADVACAVRAGIHSAWITRDRSWMEADYTPTISVASLERAVDRILTNATEIERGGLRAADV